MSRSRPPTQSSGVSAAHPNLRPFQKGQSGNPGGLSKRIRAFRKDAQKRLPRALERLDELLDSADPENWKFALEWLRKAFIPAPKDVLDARPPNPLEGKDTREVMAELVSNLPDAERRFMLELLTKRPQLGAQ